MRKIVTILLAFMVACSAKAQTIDSGLESLGKEYTETFQWIGAYPMSFFTKTRTAKTVGKDHLSVSLKYQYFDWNLIEENNGEYQNRTSGHRKERNCFVLCTKYGWVENHHIALGIPYFMNDFDIPNKENNSHGFANIFLFEKWNIVKETNTIPGIALDFWYFFPSGDSDRKLGSDDAAYKISTEISMAWEYFSLHFNPNYLWSEDKDADVGELNGAILYKAYAELWPAIEYNYIDMESKGHRHDIVTGFIWKFRKGWSFKTGIPINLDSSFTDRDRVGLVLKLFRRW